MQGCYEEDGKKLCEERLLDTQWLDSTVQRWCELQRKRVLKTMSKALDVFYKRSSVSAFRIASLMQYLYQLEGVKEEQEIHKLVKQIYLACADRILQNMLGKWGHVFEEINAESELVPYKTNNWFDELPQQFSRDFLAEYLKRNDLKTPVKNFICNWTRKGWIKKIDKNVYSKTGKESKKKTTKK